MCGTAAGEQVGGCVTTVTTVDTIIVLYEVSAKTGKFSKEPLTIITAGVAYI